MILIYPPVAKPGEAPAGIAKLSGSLKHHGIKHFLIDANLEALNFLLNQQNFPSDTWTRRACRNIGNHISILTSNSISFSSFDRYKRAVLDINRLLERAGKKNDIHLSLSDYRDRSLSPLKSYDLLKSAEYPEKNIFYPYFSNRLPQMIEEKNARFIGFSLNYLSQALCTFAMIGFVRRFYPFIKIILGGGLVTSWTSNPNWTNPFAGLVDFVTSGAGEKSLLTLAGVSDIKPCTLPDYSQLLANTYLSPGTILPYSASRGCLWNRCTFCPEKTEATTYQSIPERTVINDIDSLSTDMAPSLIHLLDNTISLSLLTAMTKKETNIPWYGFTRISKILTDIHFCRLLKQKGCVMLKIGLESGSQYVLDELNKGIDLELASRTLKTLRKADIGTYVYLLFGTPPETAAEAKKTMEFTLRHHREINFLNLSIFNLPRYGSDAEKLQTSLFYEGDLSLYSQFNHPKGWNRQNVRTFLDKEFKRNGSIASIVRKTPPFFTSNHAPFFLMNSK